MRVVFIGTGDIGVPALEHLAASRKHELAGVVTQPDRPAGRGLRPQASPVKRSALARHVQIFQPENINCPTAIAQLRYLRADVFVVVAFGQILAGEVLQIPSRACINIHASLLPRHRGAAPIQAALRSGDRHSGITIIWMDEGLDTGDILLQKKTVIRLDDTAQTLHDRLAQMAPDALDDALDLLDSRRATRLPQDPTRATYAKKLKKEDGRILWNQPQRGVDHHIRAMNPWPGAYTFIPSPEGPRMLKIFATILSSRAKGKPGEILRTDEHGILVACGKGGLLLREVQLEGKRRIHAADFLRGYDLPIGTVLS
ncbi:MAG: methionyl-tRNA formyltransferase [Verrucomicrobiae bacterium]|nr:methionyl-tRNA formyltransferase [Verrucomicrobiae bacterium]